MNKKKFQRVVSLALALLCVFSSASLFASAEDVLLIAPAPSSGGNSSSITDATIDDVREILNSMSYDEYFKKYSRVSADEGNIDGRVWTVDRAAEAIVIDAVKDVNAENSDAAYAVGTFGGVEALFTPADGTVAWNVAIPETARYSVVIEYYPTQADAAGNAIGKSTAIERIFRIDSTIPFLEARYLIYPILS